MSKLKEQLLNVIDTGGDTPHTVHNASVKLSTDKKIENVLDALHVDLEEVTQRESLQTIGKIIGMEVRSSKRRLEHRWLNQVPILEQFFEELDVLTLFFSAFVSDATLNAAQELVCGIFESRGVSEEGIYDINLIINKARNKFIKQANHKVAVAKNRRKRIICEALFYERSKFLMLVAFQFRQLSLLNECSARYLSFIDKL